MGKSRLKIQTADYLTHDLDICQIANQSRYTRDFTSHRFFRDGIQETYDKGEVGVALELGRVVGFVYVKHIKIRSRPYSVIHYMGVHEAWRGHGIGAKLLDWALHTSPHRRVQLSCEHANEKGMRFYEACGYVEVGRGVYGSESRPRPYTRFEKALPKPV